MQVDTHRVVLFRKDEYVTVGSEMDQSLITLTWTGFAPSPVFRSILEDALLNVRLHKLSFWLADLRGMNAILRQDEQWSSNDWFPRLANSGLRRMAILMSSDYFNQMSVERIMTNASPALPFEVRYFEDPEAARTWLLSAL
jgi:SpoIIAA-like